MRKLFLKNIDEYRDAARRLDAIGKIEPGSPAPPEYELLLAAVDRWEETHEMAKRFPSTNLIVTPP